MANNNPPITIEMLARQAYLNNDVRLAIRIIAQVKPSSKRLSELNRAHLFSMFTEIELPSIAWKVLCLYKNLLQEERDDLIILIARSKDYFWIYETLLFEFLTTKEQYVLVRRLRSCDDIELLELTLSGMCTHDGNMQMLQHRIEELRSGS